MSYPLKFRLHVLGVREREDLTLLATASHFAVGISTLKREFAGRAFFRRYIESSTESYSEMSPINHASDYNLPLLVVHGFRDHQVNYAHSKDMVSKLKSAGKDVRFITLENETHYLDKEKSRIILLKEMEVFLAKHLK